MDIDLIMIVPVAVKDAMILLIMLPLLVFVKSRAYRISIDSLIGKKSFYIYYYLVSIFICYCCVCDIIYGESWLIAPSNGLFFSSFIYFFIPVLLDRFYIMGSFKKRILINLSLFITYLILYIILGSFFCR